MAGRPGERIHHAGGAEEVGEEGVDDAQQGVRDDRIAHQGDHRGADLRTDHPAEGLAEKYLDGGLHGIVERGKDHRIGGQRDHRGRQRLVDGGPQIGIPEELGGGSTQGGLHACLNVGVGLQRRRHFRSYRVEIPAQCRRRQFAGRIGERGHHAGRAPEIGEQGVHHIVQPGLDHRIGRQGHHHGAHLGAQEFPDRTRVLLSDQRGDVLGQRRLDLDVIQQCVDQRRQRHIDIGPHGLIAEQPRRGGGDAGVHPVVDRGIGLELLLHLCQYLGEVAFQLRGGKRAGGIRQRVDDAVGAQEGPERGVDERRQCPADRGVGHQADDRSADLRTDHCTEFAADKGLHQTGHQRVDLVLDALIAEDARDHLGDELAESLGDRGSGQQ